MLTESSVLVLAPSSKFYSHYFALLLHFESLQSLDKSAGNVSQGSWSVFPGSFEYKSGIQLKAN